MRSFKKTRESGFFIFDINTPEKLKAISAFRPAVINLGRDLMIMKVTSPDGRITDWDITIFEHTGKNGYRRWKDHTKEISFSTSQVEKKLRRIYKKVWIEPTEVNRFNNSHGRLYFCCRK